MMQNFIRSNFQSVIEIQSSFYRDEQMINSISNQELTMEMVKSWMRNYGLFQGLNTQIRNDVAKTFIEFAYSSHNNPIDIEVKFKELHSRLYKIRNRKWISATSKLLWCIDPKKVVIYDAFVERAVTVLQCLDSDLASHPRIGSAPDAKKDPNSELITAYYMNYQNIVKSILHKHTDLILKLKREYKTTYQYEVRIIDKLLWLMGSLDSQFKLDKITCKPI